MSKQLSLTYRNNQAYFRRNSQWITATKTVSEGNIKSKHDGNHVMPHNPFSPSFSVFGDAGDTEWTNTCMVVVLLCPLMQVAVMDIATFGLNWHPIMSYVCGFSLLWGNSTTRLLSVINAANWLECTVKNCMSGKCIVFKKAWTQSNANVFMCYFLTLSSRLPSDRSCWRSKYGIIQFEWHPMYWYDGTVVQNII